MMEMLSKILIILASLIVLYTSPAVCARPCRSNKVAPGSRADRVEGRQGPDQGRTFGYLFGLRPFGDQPSSSSAGCTPQQGNPNDNPSLVTIDGDVDQLGADYVDPVYSGEEADYQPNVPTKRPQKPSGLLDWWPDLGWQQPQNRPPRPQRPQRPPRPQRPQRPPHRPPNYRPPIHRPPTRPPNWFWNWFEENSNKPTRPPRPDYGGDDNEKPVYEHIENEQENVSWKPSLIVGGPNNNIIGLTQDLSNWSTSPRPPPTRPQIPGYPEQSGTNRNNQGIINSFIDLLFKE